MLVLFGVCWVVFLNIVMMFLGVCGVCLAAMCLKRFWFSSYLYAWLRVLFWFSLFVWFIVRVSRIFGFCGFVLYVFDIVVMVCWLLLFFVWMCFRWYYVLLLFWFWCIYVLVVRVVLVSMFVFVNFIVFFCKLFWLRYGFGLVNL